jgi:hypothetical protein
MMKKFVFILALILISISFSAKAQWWYDFSDNTTGQDIYYKITSNNPPTVAVGLSMQVTNVVTVPQTVPYNGVVYTVTAIDDTAFVSTNITSVILPSTIDSIGFAAFAFCNSLASIIINAVTPPSVETWAFHNVDTTILITVPCGSIPLYQTAPNWNNFSSYQNSAIVINFIDSIVQGDTYNLYGFNESVAGTYTQNLQTPQGCDSTVILTLSVYTLTTPSNLITQSNQDNISLSWEGNGERYHIMRNDVLLASVTSNSFTDYDIESGTNYCYSIRSFAGNVETELSSPSCITFLPLNDVVNQEFSSKLYPNPAHNKTTLELTGVGNDAKVILCDMLGKEIKNYNLKANQTKLDIDLNNITKGIYYIRIINNDRTSTKKLIVK